MYGPSVPSGDSGGSLAPVSPRSIGVGVGALSVLGFVGYSLLTEISGLVFRTDSVYFFLGLFGLGVALVVWDYLTDRFDEGTSSPNQF